MVQQERDMAAPDEELAQRSEFLGLVLEFLRDLSPRARSVHRRLSGKPSRA